MDRMGAALINGEERPLNYSIAVMFDMAEKYGDIASALDVIARDNMESFEAIRWFAVRMANDAELCRRDMGYDHKAMIEESDISPRISPLDFEQLKAAVVDAIVKGYQKETEDKDDEIDLGLEELHAKKTKAGA